MSEGVYIRPDPIPMGGDNVFANDTMTVRVPRIIREVQAMNPHLGDTALHRLDQLHAALVHHAPIAPLDALPAPGSGYADWQAVYEAQRQKHDPLTWFNSDWFFAEIFCYRHIIEAVRWFETGRDPFAPKKREELTSDRLLNLLKATQTIDGDFKECLATLLAFVLWGNRVDLSHPAGDLSAESAADDLLVDDRPALFEYLAAQHAGGALDLSGTTIHIIADNAGTELATDLALVDLLTTGGATVVLHVKAHPTFVSDAIAADVWDVMALMQASGGTLDELAARLRRTWDAEQFRIAPDLYWNSGHFLWELPPTLHRVFRQADLVVIKGDVNYRRAVGDALWDPSTPFPAVMRYFPAPVLALRSIKCDVVVGLPPDVPPRLDALNPVWRTSGQYGVMQFSAPVRPAE